MDQEKDEAWMVRALQLAERGLFSTAPNPRVGCVIIKGDSVVGEGWHRVAGAEHAEVLALKDAEGNARGATVYINMEPCSHTGRTGPCVDELIKAQVERVVCAIEDPNPLVKGRGIRRLKESGIKVSVGVLEDAAVQLNIGFINRMTRGRPWFRIKVAAGLDGKTALENGESKWITGDKSRDDVHEWRARSCGILTGIGTLAADNPQLNVRRVKTDRQPVVLITDSNLKALTTSKVFNNDKVLLITANEDSGQIKKFEDKGVDVLSLPNQFGKVDLRALAKELGKRQFNEVLTEAGCNLHSALLREGIFDEIIVYYAPIAMGVGGRGMLNIGDVATMADVPRFVVKEVTTIGPDIRVRAFPKLGD